MGASTRPGAPEDYRLAMTSPVDEYIDATTGEARAKLTQLRDLIRTLAPGDFSRISRHGLTNSLNRP